METIDKSSEYNKMANTPVQRLILSLSIPSIVSMMITNVYNLADTSFVGRLGTSASGAVGVVFGFMSIIQAFGFMFGQGAGSILSRALGKKDYETASEHASAGFFSSLLAGFMITVFGFLFLDKIVKFLGSTDTIYPYAKTYISYILLASPFMSSSLTLNNILRYEGKAILGMMGLMTGALLNIILDPILMFGLNMEISGAGISTALSQIISWLILLFMFICGQTQTKLSFKKAISTNRTLYFNIMATGFPSLLRQGLNSLTTVILNSQCAIYGDAAVAGMSIVSRIIFFVFSICIGVGQGFQPVCAFNYGAGKYSRVKDGYFFTLIMGECVIVTGCLFLIIFPEHLITIFRNDPKVIEIGARALVLQAIASIVLPICMTCEMLFQSTGKKLGASFLSALRSGVFFIPLVFILEKFRGLHGIEESQPIAIFLSMPFAIPLAIRFFRKMPKNDL